tara:strand:+ start:295 stop:1065 length:771 start_codon:yes stop_codon:yes gene_type:complete
MSRLRIIPVLLTDHRKMVKGKKFSNHKYIGDPVNALKIFNDKQVDELLLLDISATNQLREPDYKFLEEIASEAFFPLAYGGGINSVAQIEKLMRIGIEKIVLGTSAFLNPNLVKEASAAVGAQSVIVSVDYKNPLIGKSQVFVKNGKKKTRIGPLEYAKKMEQLGAGELIITSIDREGVGNGYDLKLLASISKSVTIPVVASGGAGNLSDFVAVKNCGHVHAISAGSMFVYYGPHKAVLINYPSYEEIDNLFNGEI